MRMLAFGKTAQGGTVSFFGSSSSELEREADARGCVRYEFQIDGGKEVVAKISGQWVRI